MNVLDNIFNKKQSNFFLIAGPCVVENSKDTFKICEEIIKSCDNIIFLLFSNHLLKKLTVF